MYGGDAYYGAHYGVDDTSGTAGHGEYSWYPGTESVAAAAGSASLSIVPSAFPPHPSTFSSPAPGDGWLPTQTAPPALPYYPQPPPPHFWGNNGFPAHSAAYPGRPFPPNGHHQATTAMYLTPSYMYSTPMMGVNLEPTGMVPPPAPSSSTANSYIPSAPQTYAQPNASTAAASLDLDNWLMEEAMSFSVHGSLSADVGTSSASSRTSTPFDVFDIGTPSTGSGEAWPSTSSSGSSRSSSVDPPGLGLFSLDPEDARLFMDNGTQLRFAEDEIAEQLRNETTPAPSMTQRGRKRTSKKKKTNEPLEPTDVGRLEDLDWQPSDTVWLDEGVSSEYVEFPRGLKLTSQKPIFRLERVHGVPSELPHFETPTAFILSIPNGVFPQNMTPDNVFRNLCPHSFTSSTGHRTEVDTHLSGFFFGRDASEKIDVRRATPTCKGVYVCSSIDRTFVETPRRTLDPEMTEKLVQATLRQREHQDDTLVGQVLAFIRAIEKVRCRGIRPDGTRCTGSVSAVRRLTQRANGKNNALKCTEDHTPLAPGSSHSVSSILVDESLFLKAKAGERIVDAADDDQLCAGVVSMRNMSGTVKDCEFNHSKDGRPFTAKLEHIRCGAKITFFCPYEKTYKDEEDLVRTAIAYPHPEHCHYHPTALGTKCPCTAREKYKEAGRVFGVGATVAKVENAPSTKQIFGTATPGEYHSSLMNSALKNRLLREVRAESSAAGDSAAEALAAYISQQQAIPDPEKRYIHSMIWRDGKRIIFGVLAALLRRIHQLRALDVDTTYKPVKGVLQVFAISGWLSSQNRAITVMRVWMEVHDEASFKLVWTEIFRLVLLLTGHPLRFKRVHSGGKIMGLLSDMEAAPLLGFASALWEEMTPEYRAKIGNVESTLSYVLRICGVHFNRGISDLKHLSKETQTRLQQLRHLRNSAELAEFKAWLHEIDDPSGRVKAWWKHKTMHHWLLPGLIQFLSNIGDDWDLLEPNTNLGEGQHRWNNIQTGVDMGIVESLIKYEQLDGSQAALLETGERTGDLRNVRNNLVQRYVSRSTRRIAAREKHKRAAVVDAKVRLREVTVAETKYYLKKATEDAESDPSPSAKAKVKALNKQLREAKVGVKKAKAEAKSNSSGRVQNKQRIGSRKLTFVDTDAPSSLPHLASQVPDPIAHPHAEEDAVGPPVRRTTRVSRPTAELVPAPAVQSSEPAVPAIAHGDPATRRPQPKRRGAARAGSAPPRKRVKALDLDWALFVDGEKMPAREYARIYPDDFAAQYPEYLPLIDREM
ncbi:hypothetical protein C8F01DRAFT_1169151 [Mycena amicta]|nr:hypothetical protein C8F01DRAFT_1169151 [Mycena amicta]